MITFKLNSIKDNVEAALSFGLFGLLVWVGVYFIGIEKTRAMLLKQAGSVSPETSLGGKDGGDIGLSQQRSFLGLLMPKPPSYYNSIVRRNAFAPLPTFIPPVGDEIRASKLELTITMLLPEGEGAERIRNKRTGKTYYVKEGDEIAEKFKVKKIENRKVILSTPDGEEIVLEQPAVILDFSLISDPFMSEAEEWVARIRNNITGEAYSVREGDEIDEMCRVKEIDRDRVVLSVTARPDIILTRDVGVGFAYMGAIKIGIGDKAELKALINNLVTGESKFVGVGDVIDGFTVKQIEWEKMILSREGEDISLIKGES